MALDTQKKILKIISIAIIVLTSLSLIMGLIATLFGGAIVWSGAELANQVPEAENDAFLLAGMGAIAILIGIILLAACAFSLAVGILGLGVAKDGRRVKAYMVLCIILLVLDVIALIGYIADGSFSFITLADIAITGFALYVANNIKKELQA